ncbi:scaffold attachment factor B2-like isoform X2 [Pseudophryne corroboree]|uniref:scaffold attachment factor B2-like isoform X2 n=1 Tax=Pseudophryne corroboree TaxID=495146 RepID=UPI003081CA54
MADSQPPVDTGVSTDAETKKLSELRVIDLKAELKRRNLDTGGNKSALMERLKKAIEEEGGNPEEIQLSPDTPSKKTPKRSGRVRKQEEGAEDNGLEEDSGDSQENEETSLEQENEKVLDILGESDKSEQLKEEAPEGEESVNQDDSCVESEKTKDEEEVFVTIESADSTLDLDGESNQECEAEDTKALGDRESKEQSTHKDTDLVEIDKTSGQSSQKQPNLGENLECENKPLDEGAKKIEGTEGETSATRESSAKEDDQKMSSTEEETDKSITKDEKGQIDANFGKNLWVSGLSSTTRATDLKNLFSKYGKVVGAKVVTNARSPGARCYGFVTMSSSEDATKCISHLHRTELHGRMISVEKAKNEPAGKKPLDKRENETRKEKSLSGDRRHSTEKSEKSSPSKKDEVSDKGDDKNTDKDKEDHKSGTSDRSRTSKSGSRGTERTVVMDKSKGEPVISVKTSSPSKERSSKSQDRKSESKDKKEILSFDKIKEQRERERQRQREREIREMERQRERDRRVRERVLMVREKEERERLRRERMRLEFERERLERERMERERLERERMRVEDERRREQERIQRERDELRRQQERLRYELDRRPGVRRPYDVDGRRDDAYWPESKRMAMDDRYREFGRPDRFQDFDNRDRGRYVDNNFRDESRSGLGGRDVNYPDRHGREPRDGWGDYDRRVSEGRGIPSHGRDGRDWGDHGRKMEADRTRAGGRGMPPGPSGQGHMNRGMHGNFLQNENSPNMSATLGLQGGNFGGQNRPNDPRFTRY